MTETKRKARVSRLCSLCAEHRYGRCVGVTVTEILRCDDFTLNKPNITEEERLAWGI